MVGLLSSYSYSYNKFSGMVHLLQHYLVLPQLDA